MARGVGVRGQISSFSEYGQVVHQIDQHCKQNTLQCKFLSFGHIQGVGVGMRGQISSFTEYDQVVHQIDQHCKQNTLQ